MLNFRRILICGIILSTGLFGQSYICDINSIYNPNEFEYFLPKNTLASFLDGVAFDSKESYSKEEKSLLLSDIVDIYAKIEKQNLSPKREAIITAGPPGAGKTTLIRLELAKNSKSQNFAYIDPDDICLQSMKRTYLKDLKDALTSIHRQNFFSEEEETLTELAAKQVIYNHWRPGSNAANHLILANLIRKGLPFYLGTSSTSPHTVNLFKLLKKENYHIRLLHITASDHIRWAAILKQNRGFLHSTAEDTFEKGKLFPQKLQTYLQWADTIEFYYRTEVDQPPTLAATWSKNNLTIINQEAYTAIQTVHNDYCERLERNDLLWHLPTIAIATNP